MSNTTLSLLILSLLLPAVPVKSDSSFIRLPNDLCPVASDPAACPVKCFRPDPVCGADGVTYWCGCADALCAGTTVAKLGFCHADIGGSGGQALLLVHIVWLILLGFVIVLGAL